MWAPDTIDLVEVGWTSLSTIALVGSVPLWRQARQHLAYVRRSQRPHLARSFREDLANVRGRAILAASLAAAGVVAMTQPAPSSRTVASWIVIALLHSAPVYLLWRNVAEWRSRRTTVAELADSAGITAPGSRHRSRP